MHLGTSRGSGFTLLELLAVIATIALLAALLLPALHRARTKAYQAVCLSNQRQLNLNARQHRDNGQDLGLLDSLPDAMWPHPQYWICPSAARPAAGNWGGSLRRCGTVDSVWDFTDPAWQLDFRIAGSYGVNMWLLGYWAPADADPAGKYKYLREQNITRPPLTPVYADCIIYAADPTAMDQPPRNLVNPMAVPPWYGEMCFFAIPRHGRRPNPVPTTWPSNRPLPGAVNVSFFDGHGEAVKLDRLWQLYWHKDYESPVKRPGLP